MNELHCDKCSLYIGAIQEKKNRNKYKKQTNNKL